MKIAIIGAGNGGTKLLNFFMNNESSEVIQIIDQNFDSPGIKTAKENHIQCSTDINDVNEKVDLIVEATGSSFVAEKLFELYGHSKKIISSELAAIIMGVIDEQVQNTNKLSEQLEIIQNTSTSLEDQMNNLNDFSSSLNNISKKLVISSNEYKKYIEQTDTTIKAVNKITQQIKILGLNANIEAARAGEHGRGFAVVATEVQKLSNITSDFAMEISKLLESMGVENTKISDEIESLGKVTIKQTETSEALTHVVETLKSELIV
ncbi:methyl-accepting chemotaxis protein [Helicovermis profundi]|uniref:Methyl-accepting chemotaxis protein n=1 Tax=Helicovermis profundi TaxID=3065157 RepID=A0AAU9E7B0_9FIRM|nr:methyl-accepting chemotaxis protein [Clostridia bacterium S502]